ncbi:hypothetical protein LTR15_006391 [Elasticomyces elasticus]|nr:hypothetical protein LTR15_006391 [Elasticomyces elasticus]
MASNNSAVLLTAAERFEDAMDLACTVRFNRSEKRRNALGSAAVDFMLSVSQNPQTQLTDTHLRNMVEMADLSSEERRHIAQICLQSASTNANILSLHAMHARVDNMETLQRYANDEQLIRLATTAEELSASIMPFPFLQLPPEIRNTIYELSIPDGGDRTLPSPCGCHVHDGETTREPAITKVCRQIRTESLPIYYDYNHLQLHTLRYDCSAFIAHCERIRTWGVKKIKAADVYIGEIELSPSPVVRCGDTLWGLFKWLAVTKMSVNLKCDFGGNFTPMLGAIALATHCREENISGDGDLRAVFDDWLRMLDMNCRCAAAEYREGGVWYTCSRHIPGAGEVTCE